MNAIKLYFYLLFFLIPILGFAQPQIIVGKHSNRPLLRNYVDVKANSFEHISRLELVIEWDSSRITYERNPPSSISLAQRVITNLEGVELIPEDEENRLKIIMTTMDSTGLTVEDGTTLFQILFRPLVSRSISPIKIRTESKLYQLVNGVETEISFKKEEGYLAAIFKPSDIEITETTTTICAQKVAPYRESGIYLDVFKSIKNKDSLRILDLTLESFQSLDCEDCTFFIPEDYSNIVLPNFGNPSCIAVSASSCFEDNVSIQSDVLPTGNIFGLGDKRYTYIYDDGIIRDSCKASINIEVGVPLNAYPSIKIEDQEAIVGRSILVDVIIENFQNVTSTNFSLQWDETFLEYGFEFPLQDIVGFSKITSTEPGKITFNFEKETGLTLPDNSKLFTILFNGKKTGTTSLDFFEFAPVEVYQKIDDVVVESNILLSNGVIDLKMDCGRLEYTEYLTVCQGERYTFNNVDLFESGTYRDTLSKEDGCDSIILLNLTFRPIQVDTRALICNGDTYVFKDRTLSESGIYRDTFLQPNGCDSIVKLELIVRKEDTISSSHVLCEGGFIKIRDTEIKEVGLHEFFYPNKNTMSRTCGTRYFVEIEFLPSGIDTFVYHQTICERDTIVLFNTALHTEGLYEFPSETIGENNCTVLFFVDLEVIPPSFDTIQVTICQGESYLFGFSNNTLTESGFYYQNVQSSQLCDSIIVLSLEVLEELKQEETINICQGETYTIGGQILTETGTYETMLSSQLGCDSLVITNLIVEIGKEAETDVDLITCEDELALVANLPNETKGAWTGNEFAIIADADTTSTNVTNLPIGKSTFYWTLSSEKCLAYSRDSITITRLAIPSATQDSFLVKENTPRTFDVTTNDSFGEMNWLVLLNTVPMVGQLEVVENGIYQYTPQFGFSGQVSFEYQICNEFCLPEGCTTAEVVLTIQSDQIGITMDPTPIPPSTNFESSKIKLTNHTIEIGELFVFNIWGQQVAKRQFFQDSQQQLNNLQQNELPAGIYFYVKKSKDKSAILESGKIVAIGR